MSSMIICNDCWTAHLKHFKSLFHYRSHFFIIWCYCKKYRKLTLFSLRRTKIFGTHAHLCFLTCILTKCLVFPQETLTFQPLSPVQCWDISMRIFQSGKISAVLDIDHDMITCCNARSLHQSMSAFFPTLNGGRGMLKIVHFPQVRELCDW